MNLRTGVLVCLLICIVAAPCLPCSVFTAHQSDKVLAGNNEDYYGDNPTLLWFSPPQDGLYGYAAWGFEFNHFAQGGMNDQGLFWDGLMTPEHEILNAGTKPFESTTLEEIMQTSATVEEAITNLLEYDISGVLREAQLIFADRFGNSAILEGDIVIEPDKHYQVATNFLQSDPRAGGYPCWRYDVLNEMMETGLTVTVDYFAEMADACHQGIEPGPGIYTRYTTIGDLVEGQLYLYYDLYYGKYLQFDLAGELLLGEHEYLMSDLFEKLALGEECTSEEDCLSGLCVHGVCCDSVCGGICDSCNLEGAEGTCSSLPDGTSCADSDLCDGEETCNDGKCEDGELLTCHDDHACTIDTCDPVVGCIFQPMAIECKDDNPCTRDICDIQVGCRYEDMPEGMSCGDCKICAQGMCSADPDCGAGGSGCGTAQSHKYGWLMWTLLLPVLFGLSCRRRR